ncbi:MAG: diguanylate cyclase [Phycisphaerales bacterium]|nr:diguanylate cyclase [Phycisphaerales bacterium]
MSHQERKPVLLLIDDQPAIHRLLAVKLRNEELEFLTAFCGEEGLELAREQQPSLILLDLNMPETTGFEVLKSLKGNTETMEIPVIIVSGSADSADKVRAFELGAMDYVCKPFDVPELRARIQSAIKLHRLMKMLEQRAQIDGLTGLWNRAYFDKRLGIELNTHRRSNRPLALVLCDLDHFKKLNDNFGHPAGDAVLQGFASILNRELRSSDVACRYGGEEFALILPDTSCEDAVRACDRIRLAIEAKRWKSYPEMAATASFGVAHSGNATLQTGAAWIEAADGSLYDAKGSGRNRVHVHGAGLAAGGDLTPPSEQAA